MQRRVSGCGGPTSLAHGRGRNRAGTLYTSRGRGGIDAAVPARVTEAKAEAEAEAEAEAKAQAGAARALACRCYSGKLCPSSAYLRPAAPRTRKAARRLVKKKVEVESFYSVLVPLLRLLLLIPTVALTTCMLWTSRVAAARCCYPWPWPARRHICRCGHEAECCRLLEKRAGDAGLRNVSSACAMMKSTCRARARMWDPRVDVVLGLHACGNATDYIMEQALRLDAALSSHPAVSAARLLYGGGTSFHRRPQSWANFQEDSRHGAGGGAAPRLRLRPRYGQARQQYGNGCGNDCGNGVGRIGTGSGGDRRKKNG